MLLSLQDISYLHPDRSSLFEKINLSLEPSEKISLVGDNGSGKTTLLRIAAGELTPASGLVQQFAKHYYVPQNMERFNNMSVAQTLGVQEKISALHAILAGDLTPGNYEALADDWDIEEKLYEALDQWHIPRSDTSRLLGTMSGGEKTKVLLAGIALHAPEIILFDEPTNHLDYRAREQLYDFIVNYKGAMIVVSHDRTLLSLLDVTYELTSKGLHRYGGNYEFYREQKSINAAALENRIDEQLKTLRKAEGTARKALQRKTKSDSRGRAKLEKEGVPRIAINTIRGGAERSASKLREKHENKLVALSGELTELRSSRDESARIKIRMPDSSLHSGKTVIEAKELNYDYGDGFLWEEDLDFIVRSGDRIAIRGDNGSGKSTLVKLILSELQPQKGRINVSFTNAIYIDQQYSLLNGDLSVLAHLERSNRRNLEDHMLKTELHRFLFPKETWDKKCDSLSGGEKMRLIFCSMLISQEAVQLIILDEPTNNLDITTLEIIAETLKSYSGTLLVVSHDRSFLEQMGITAEIELHGKKQTR